MPAHNPKLAFSPAHASAHHCRNEQPAQELRWAQRFATAASPVGTIAPTGSRGNHQLTTNALPTPPSVRWHRDGSVCFNRRSVRYSNLSNMAQGFPVVVAGQRYVSVEHVYQGSRFTDDSERRKLVLAEPTPLGAKKRARRALAGEIREDWDDVKSSIMANCLRLKAEQHVAFRRLLQSTGDLILVEESSRDDWWGAIPVSDTELEGRNMLGLLLMELRIEFSG